jgi:hypothetical protein
MRIKMSGLRSCLTLLLILLAVSGCAAGARSDAMIAAMTPETMIDASSPLRNAVRIGTVTGGGETNPAWLSNVSAADFRTALEQSFAAHGMAAAGPGHYTIDVDLLTVDRPIFAFDMTVAATILYTITGTGGRVEETVVTPPYTEKFSDTPFGPERLRLAVEGGDAGKYRRPHQASHPRRTAGTAARAGMTDDRPAMTVSERRQPMALARIIFVAPLSERPPCRSPSTGNRRPSPP